MWFVTQVKDYVMRQWSKILAGRVSLADFVFAKEVRTLVLFQDLLAMLLAAHWPCSWFAVGMFQPMALIESRLRAARTLLSDA